MSTQQVLAFDIYGTLLDTSSIAKALSEHLSLDDGKAAEISSLWRRYQLEYTWRMNSMGIYEPFDEVTRGSLLHALKENNIKYTDEIVKKVMDAYNILPCFSDTVQALSKLRGSPNVKIVVFSNGTQAMVQNALAAANISDFTSDIYVADAIKRYKPAAEIYKGLLAKVGLESSPAQCWLVSGNPFDVTGAINVGMRAMWVDRKGAGWADGLLTLGRGGDLSTGGPTLIVKSLGEIADRMVTVSDPSRPDA